MAGAENNLDQLKPSGSSKDYNCTDCLSRENVYTKAVFYCPKCHKYECKACLVCDHETVGRDKVKKWGKSASSYKFDTCSKHRGQAIQLFCPTHDEVCCPVCSQMTHKTCLDVQFIPLIVNGKGNMAELNKIKISLGQLFTKADSLGKDRSARLADLNKTEQQMVADVKAYRAKVNTWLDEAEKRSLEDIKNFKVLCMGKYKSELTLCDTIKTEMTQLQKNIKTTIKDEVLQFSRLKQGKEQIEDNSNLVSDMESSEIEDIAKFVPHTNIEEFIKRLEGLGKLLTDKSVPDQITQPVIASKPYRLEKKTSFSVKTKDDKKVCQVRSMCQMPDGSIIVADCENNSLKQIDSKYTVVRQCSLTSSPWSICHTEAGQVAVGLYGKTIQFVSVGKKMISTQSFPTDHPCDSLAYSNKCLYVTEIDGKSVFAYNLSGTRLRVISTEQHGFCSTRCITISTNGDRLHVIDWYKGLITVDTSGLLLATYNSPEMEDCNKTICVDGEGDIFIGVDSYKNYKVLQVEKSGDVVLAEILSHSDGIRPVAICFDDANARLLVSSADGDILHVLHLSKKT